MFQRLTPVASNLLIINVLMLVASYVLQGGNVDLWNLLGMHHPWSADFMPHQIVTHMFMHGGFGHLLMNMLGLFFLGGVIEWRLGPQRFLFYWLATGLGAALLHLAVVHGEILFLVRDMPADTLEIVRGLEVGDPATADQVRLWQVINGTMVGASGAVFGLLIAIAVLFPTRRSASSCCRSRCPRGSSHSSMPPSNCSSGSTGFRVIDRPLRAPRRHAFWVSFAPLLALYLTSVYHESLRFDLEGCEGAMVLRNMTLQIIFVNVGVFLAVHVVRFIVNVTTGFTSNPLVIDPIADRYFMNWLGMPMTALEALMKPWTAFTYMFLHEGILHIFFNMLWLFWFGRILQDLVGAKRILPIYVFGGLAGGVLALLGYALIPELGRAFRQLPARRVGERIGRTDGGRRDLPRLHHLHHPARTDPDQVHRRGLRPAAVHRIAVNGQHRRYDGPYRWARHGLCLRATDVCRPRLVDRLQPRGGLARGAVQRPVRRRGPRVAYRRGEGERAAASARAARQRGKAAAAAGGGGSDQTQPASTPSSTRSEARDTTV